MGKLQCLSVAKNNDEKLMAIGHASAEMGISFQQMLDWMRQYGIPTLIKVLTMIGPLVGQLPYGELVKWITAALIAIQGGNPVPPLPSPTPAS